MHHDDPKRTEMFEHLIHLFDIQSFIETGAWAAETPIYFLPMVKEAMTCETYRPRYEECVKISRSHPSLTISPLSSELFLQKIKPIGPCMFYLDAHFEDYWPLRDELRIIRQRWPRSVIAIDDAFVPDRPNFAGVCGGGGDKRKIYGSRTTVDKTALDIDLISPLVPGTQIMFPRYPDKTIGYCIVNGFEKRIKDTNDFQTWVRSSRLSRCADPRSSKPD